jgi:hypothetical protein
MKTGRIFFAGCCLFSALGAVGCGGSGGSAAAAASPLTQSQSMAVMSDLYAAVIAAPLVAGVLAQTSLAAIEAARIRQAVQRDGAVSEMDASPQLRPEDTTTLTMPAFTYACPTGGSITVNGTFTGTYTPSAPGSLTGSEDVVSSIVETINSCSDSGVVFSGDPNITLTSHVTLLGNIFTDSMTMTGGLLVGNKACMVNVTLNASLSTTTNAETGTISGTMCGMTLNGSL